MSGITLVTGLVAVLSLSAVAAAGADEPPVSVSLQVDALLGPETPLILPGRGESLRLDDQSGPEDLYVVATTRQPADALRRDCLRRLAESPPPPPPPPKEDKPPPPGPIDGNERNPPLRFDPRSRTLVARAGKGGTAALRFPYKHERRAAR